jgi:hypothetical protein
MGRPYRRLPTPARFGIALFAQALEFSCGATNLRGTGTRPIVVTPWALVVTAGEQARSAVAITGVLRRPSTPPVIGWT